MIEALVKKRDRASKIYSLLKEEYPNSKCSLHYTTPHELLVATILSAQCTDDRVNMVTKHLFKKYHSPKDFAYCNLDSLSEDIHSCGYHNQKAKNIQGASLIIVEEHKCVVPSSLDELVALPGVGRKTANCVLGEIYNVPSMVVDTHMVRIMNLLGFTRSNGPKKIEPDIMDAFEEKVWIKLFHMLICYMLKISKMRRTR